MTVSILESPAVEKPVRCKPWLYFAALPLHASAASSWPPVQNCPTPRRTIWRRRSPRCFGEAQLLAPTSVRYAGNETLSAIVYRRIAISTLQKRKRVHRRDAPPWQDKFLNLAHFTRWQAFLIQSPFTVISHASGPLEGTCIATMAYFRLAGTSHLPP